jgi:hypothetical protein
MARSKFVILFFTVGIVAVLLFLSSCGGGSASPAVSSNPPAPTPPPPPSTPPPPPPGTPPSGGGGSSSGAVNPSTFTAGLIGFYPGNPSAHPHVGTITVNAGQVTYQVSGFQPNERAAISFCPWPMSHPETQPCLAMNATMTTDSNGAASGSFQMPSSSGAITAADAKTFRGWFSFSSSVAGEPSLLSGFTPTFTGGTEFSEAINPIPPIPPLTAQQWGSGSVTVTNGRIHIQVNGAPANTTYQVWEAYSSEGEEQIGMLMTDASGNGSADVAAAHSEGVVVLRRVGQGDDATTYFVVP